MSKTKHSLPRSSERNLSNINQRKRIMSSIDYIKNEEHLMMKIRKLCRFLGNKRRSTNPHDDIRPSSWGEFHNKHFYDEEEKHV